MSQWVNTKHLAEILQVSESDVERILAEERIVPIDVKAEPKTKETAINSRNLFLTLENTSIYHEDFLRTVSLPQESVDLIVTSPPYNVGIDYNDHDDTTTYESYLEFSRKWLSKAFELSRPDGRLCMNIPLDKNKGGHQSVCADLTYIAKQVGWHYQSTIIWNEGNISRRTAWGSWLSASAPFVIAPVEVIVVLYKEHWKKVKRPSQVSDISRDEFMEWTNGVWTFNGESKKKIGHPAPFPRELPKRCIKLFSFIGDTVLDPFLGSGTTLLEAHVNNRVGVGFDISLEYCELAKRRLEEICHQRQLKLI